MGIDRIFTQLYLPIIDFLIVNENRKEVKVKIILSAPARPYASTDSDKHTLNKYYMLRANYYL